MAHFEHVNWNYCVLDEGHIIKNPKSKITESVKRVRARHRLVLSGTPIQNNVLDLWSIFDFLMPGYLGPIGTSMYLLCCLLTCICRNLHIFQRALRQAYFTRRLCESE